MKQISHEFLVELHNHAVLTTRLEPDYKRQSWFIVEHKYLGSCGVGYLQKDGLASLPWNVISAVKVEIDAPKPKPKDHGELICFLYKARDLVDIFNEVHQLPRAAIHILDTERAKW
ncbi:uncharacterized protein PAC_06868 [Phialocephala subalpina]|uniref:Uncharacterized protein n=1 Tax=Phialocephala subalpina TaxID=576137 RepID=A0A1L7WW44_9HELO|nr:uncharacterized protein PAC_06868 [Phialocephala subalpina]